MADLARRHGAPPLMYLRLGKVGLAVASSPAAAREVMRAHDAAFASRPWIPSMRPAMERGAVGLVFAPHGALWRQLRRDSVLELLSARRVRSSPPGRAVNVGVRLAALTADVTMRAVVDDRFDRREEFLRAIEEGSRLVTGFSLGDLFPSSRLVRFFSGTAGRVMDLHRKMFQLMDCAIRQHEERRAAMASTPDGAVKEEDEDILGLLLRIHREGGLEVPLTMDIVKSLILDLFSGGSDTSASTLEWAMSELMRNPGAMEKAQAEVRSKLQGKPSVTEDDLHHLKYLKLVIKETLRLHPVLPLLLPRECTEDRKVMGYDVPQGTVVLVNAWAISRDSGYWDDADAFKPERFEDGKIDFKSTDFEFIPFGAGRINGDYYYKRRL
ncbi:premnaspirodiene oxygenase-like [Panicum hallii]|nr:premnaspirodiene oxygenase-like [Panicum hallii]